MATESKRQLQVAELVRRNMGIVLQQEGGYIYGTQALVTVTKVKMSPDLNIAKVYLSVYNVEDKYNIIFELEENYHRVRQVLANRLKRQVRRIPELQFFEDDTLDEMYRLNALFDRISDQKGKEEEE